MAKKMTTKQSFEAAARRIQKAQQAMGKRVPSGLRMIGEEIMTDAKASRPGRGVPRDTGALAASGRVTGPFSNGDVWLTFGGASASYALIQHEDMSLNHKVGEAKYLTRALERWAGGGASVRRALLEMTQAALDQVAAGDRDTDEFRSAVAALEVQRAAL